MQSRRSNFRYLNREGKWLGFHWRGLEVSAEGALQLLSAPRFAGQSASQDAAGGAPVAPGGIAVDDSGRVFYSIPEENRVVAFGGCDAPQWQLTCLTEGVGQGSLNAPRGLLLLRRPERLLIVDSGNDRLLFFDLVNFDLREVWGEQSLGNWPMLPDAADRFNDPWSVATDEESRNVYVLDAGNQRILKFSRMGDADTDFLDNMQKSGLVPYPGALAVSGRGTETRIFVADLAANAIFVFDYAGAPILDTHGLPVAIKWQGMGGVLALAVNETTLYVGDNDEQRILSFRLTDGFPFSGEAAGFRGYVTALSIDSRTGVLLVQTSNSAQPVSLEPAGAYLNSGVLWSDAISAGDSPVIWNRLRASVTNAPGSHVEFYYKVSNSSTEHSPDAEADNPFSAEHWEESERWQSLPQDVEDFLLLDDENRSLVDKKMYLFIGARFLSDRAGTPLLTQMRADFDAESYTQYLPAIYREPAERSDFLKRFVSLFQGLFEDIEDEVDAIESYFDAFAAPAEGLMWLATWLAVELDQGEPESRLRHSISRAFRRYQWRGTIEGLRLALLEDAGVHATISEPIASSSFWAIPSPSDCSGSNTSAAPMQLGMSTQLSSMQPGGAVLGSTAELDHSYLITDAQFGEPLFAGVAWQFVVEVYRGEVNTDARLQLVKEIIEREKPAHTMYRLAFMDSRMRAGFQSRAGVDTIVSGTSGPTPLGEDGGLGLRLGGALAPRIGASRLGEDLKL